MAGKKQNKKHLSAHLWYILLQSLDHTEKIADSIRLDIINSMGVKITGACTNPRDCIKLEIKNEKA